MKSVSKTVLVAYGIIVLWLLLFKSSFDLPMVFEYGSRNLNIIPFAGNNLSEMVSNIIVFIPLGLLLGANFAQINLWRKLAYLFAFSVFIEIIQFVFAIGTTDITDVIMNTFGGCIGLALYSLGKKYLHNEKLDHLICVVVSILVIVLLLIRVLVFKVRY